MSEKLPKPIEVFFSYSHKDEELRDELEKHLSILKRQGVITGWHDRRIGAGREWEGEIDTHLDTAHVILLLISADFLASDYCYDKEMKRAMERHEAGEARVIPVILRPVVWRGAPFGKLQALPKDALPVTEWPNRDKAFENVAQGIQAAVGELTSPPAGPSLSIGTAPELEVLEDASPERRVQIYLQGDFSSLSADRQSAAIAAFAAVMETSPQAIMVYRVFEGSIVFNLGIPSDAAQRLRFLLQSNDAQLHRLGVEKIILEMESGEIEEWVIKEGNFDLVTSIEGDTEQQRAQRNRRAMLELVKSFWVKGVLEKSLHGVAMIALGMEERTGAVERPWDMVLRTPGQPSCTLPPDTKIVNVFDEMNRALLILGAPGSGKTTTLLELARDTIARAEGDLVQPIPVVLNLSSWADKQQPITDWLVDELNAKYNVPKKIARPWVENDNLLLLLDGLDEVKVEHREACVKAINDFRQEHGLTPLVVCSRVADYETLRTRLKLQGAVLLQPLTPQQVDEFLEGVGIELLAVRRTLQHDTMLQQLAQSPLMLSVMALAYQGMSAKDLGSLDSVEARRRHVFDAYAQRMLEWRGVSERYLPNQTVHWLVGLAQKMSEHAQSVFLIERMQPDWLPVQRQRWLYVIGVMLVTGLPIGLLVALGAGLPVWLVVPVIGRIFGLVIGLAAGLTVWLAARRAFGLTGGLLVGLAFGLAFRLAFGLYFGPSVGQSVGLAIGLATGLTFGLAGGRLTGVSAENRDKIEIVETLSWSWSKAMLGLAVGLIAGLTFGLVVWNAIGRPFGLSFGLSFGLAFGLSTGLATGLFSGLTGGQVEERMIPNQGIWWSAGNALSIGLVVWLAVGLPIGLACGLAWGSVYGPDSGVTVGLTVGAAIGLAFGLAVGLFFGGLACIQHFTLRFILYLNGYIPWNYARFLDYAAERIFLRKVGGGYIFIHRLLQDYFAALEQG